MKPKTKVVIIGAGFGGITLAKKLSKKYFDVLIIDRNNFHNFQPLMYQVATGGLEPYSIAYPIRRIFREYRNVSFRMAEVVSVETTSKKVITSIGELSYDVLVVATGSESNYFKFESIKNQLLTLKTIPDALNIRSYIFQNLEKALYHSREEVPEILNVAIVGGGPAGVEMAGAIAEMKKYVIPRDFPELNTQYMNINLYEAGDRLMKTMSEQASSKTLQYLQELGVTVFLNARVNGYDGSELTLENGNAFHTDTVLWTAGVKGAPIAGLGENCLMGGNRVMVDAFNQVKEHEHVFAIGDVAGQVTEETPRGLPMLAPVAQQQAKHLAKNLKNQVLGK